MSSTYLADDVDAIQTVEENRATTSTPIEKDGNVTFDNSKFSRSGPKPRFYSVSFQEHGFTCQETNRDIWSPIFLSIEQNFVGKKPHSANVSVPGVSEANKDDNYPAYKIVSCGCERRTMDTRNKGLSQSLGANEKRRNYKTLRPSVAGPIVYCIHGNKFGVARCCDDLVPEKTPTTSQPATEDEDKSNNVESEGRKTTSSGDLHCHPDRGAGGIDKRARRKLIVASVLCLLFMIMEIVGGVLANSLAIATDAAHLLTDFASFLISLFSLWVASRPATRRMSFGWHRAEVLGATISVLLIWVVTGILLYAAVQRITTMDFEIDPNIMLITSGIGVAVNIIMGCTLHQHGHSHVSSPARGREEGLGDESRRLLDDNNRRENINVRAAFIHVIGDFIQSLGVFLGALIIFFYPKYKIIDPICTFIFSVLVLLTTIRILRDTMVVLMEGIPRDVSFNIVEQTFLSVEGIVAVHNLRIWGLTTDKTALSAHLAIVPEVDPQLILREASMKIRAQYNFFEMTLQVEQFQDDMDNCTQCQPPS